MVRIQFMNSNGETFIKEFESPYQAKPMLNKVKHGNSLMVLNYGGDTPSETQELYEIMK